MASQDEIVQSSGDVAEGAIAGDIDIDKSSVDKLHKNAIGLPGVLYFCLAGSAPISAMLFNVPPIASQAGAASPPVFLISCLWPTLLSLRLFFFSPPFAPPQGFFFLGRSHPRLTTPYHPRLPSPWCPT